MAFHFLRKDSPDSITAGTTSPAIALFKQLGLMAAGCDYNIGIEIYDLHNKNKQLIRTIQTPINSFDLKPFQENKLIQATEDKINIWNVETSDLLTTLEGHSGSGVLRIALNKNESLMLSSGFDKNVILWDMIEYKQIRAFTGHTSYVRSVVFNEPKNQVISGSEDRTIRVWNMNDGSLINTLTGHSNTVNKLVVDEETSILYSASDDTTIKQWNVESGECLKTLTDHSGPVMDLVLNQEGGWLASTAWDKSIIIWDKQTGFIINRLKNTENMCRLALNPLNDQLISTSESGKILFWN